MDYTPTVSPFETVCDWVTVAVDGGEEVTVESDRDITVTTQLREESREVDGDFFHRVRVAPASSWFLDLRLAPAPTAEDFYTSERIAELVHRIYAVAQQRDAVIEASARGPVEGPERQLRASCAEVEPLVLEMGEYPDSLTFQLSAPSVSVSRLGA